MSSLEEEAEKRRQRLKAMKRAQETDEKSTTQTPMLDGKSGSDQETAELPRMKFRSYIPKDPELQDNVLPKTSTQDLDDGIERPRVGNDVEVDLEASEADDSESHRIAVKRPASPEAVAVITETDDVQLLNLAPRKPDWDLKRDVAKSLEKLERRTQRAIAEIIRERLGSSKEGSVEKEGDLDLAQAVTWGAKTQEEASFDDW